MRTLIIVALFAVLAVAFASEDKKADLQSSQSIGLGYGLGGLYGGGLYGAGLGGYGGYGLYGLGGYHGLYGRGLGYGYGGLGLWG